MDCRNINELLEKYYEGKTTLEEENHLREYFSNTNLPAEHQYLKQMFQYFNEVKTSSNPEFNIRDELNSLVEKQWKKRI